MQITVRQLRSQLRESFDRSNGYTFEIYSHEPHRDLEKVSLSEVPASLDLSVCFRYFDKYLQLAELTKDQVVLSFVYYGGKRDKTVRVSHYFLKMNDVLLARVTGNGARKPGICWLTQNGAPEIKFSEKFFEAQSLDDLPPKVGAVIFTQALNASMQ